MSSKKRKNFSYSYSCDSCNAIMVQRDVNLHTEKSCPPNPDVWVHPYIIEHCLYSTLDIFELQDSSFRYIPKENRNDFVLIPFHVLQICKIPIGDPVVIKANDKSPIPPLVKLAWPTQEKFSEFTIALSKEVAKLNSLHPKSQVTVFKLQDPLPLANEVILCCENNECYSNLEKIILRLKMQNMNKIFCNGNKVLIKHFGKTFIFKIINIIPIENTEYLSKECFYLVGPETKLILNNLIQHSNKQENLINKLGGLSEIIEELKDFISFNLNGKNVLSSLHLAKGILIHGPMGTGKSTLIEALAELFTNNVVQIQCSKIFSKVLGETEKELLSCFDRAKQLTPSIILIDDIDILCTKPNSNSEYERRIIATLSSLMDELSANEDISVVVLATTSKIHHIDKMLRSATRFGKEVEIFVPNSSQRFEILNTLLKEVNHNLTFSDVKSIADSSHGFVGADLLSMVSKALLKNYKTNQGKEKASINDFKWALSKTKPSAMKEIMVEIPNVKWEDIGGQEELKLKLKQSVEWPLKYKDSFTRLGITPPKGLLMYGPPGCSKTMIAKALATESNLNFISVKGPELFNKWVGESERAVRKVFRRARQTAPSIIFFDEIDALGGERNIASGSNVQERVLAQMLVELDGVEPLDDVTVIAATNRLDRIDPALLRPGRLDRIVYVSLPDYKTRKEIFNLQLKKTCVADDVMIEELVTKTEGYSGAEIVAVCREAALKALEENFNAENVTRNHFLEALKIIIPRTPKSLLQMYEKYSQK